MSPRSALPYICVTVMPRLRIAARRAPPVAPTALGVVDRTRRNEELAELLDRRGVEAAEWRHFLLQRAEVRLACDRKRGERLATVNVFWFYAGQDPGKTRRVFL